MSNSPATKAEVLAEMRPDLLPQEANPTSRAARRRAAHELAAPPVPSSTPKRALEYRKPGTLKEVERRYINHDTYRRMRKKPSVGRVLFYQDRQVQVRAATARRPLNRLERWNRRRSIGVAQRIHKLRG